MLQIALPNKGSLAEEAVRLVKDAGYNCRRYSKELSVYDKDNDVEFIFLRPRDIAIYVSKGVLALGITGLDLAIDSNIDIVELLSLGFAKSLFCYAVPNESNILPYAFDGLRIATSYPGLVLKDINKRKINSQIVRLEGAIEISIRLGVADIIADVVQTGKTMKEAGLKVIGQPVLYSEAILIGQKNNVTENKQSKMFIERLRGIVVAREYVMVEYDVEESSLKRACEITPGIESPTVAPLSKKGWVAVKAMAKKNQVNNIMDALMAIGARGIIVSDIRTCRI